MQLELAACYIPFVISVSIKNIGDLTGYGGTTTEIVTELLEDRKSETSSEGHNKTILLLFKLIGSMDDFRKSTVKFNEIFD